MFIGTSSYDFTSQPSFVVGIATTGLNNPDSKLDDFNNSVAVGSGIIVIGGLGFDGDTGSDISKVDSGRVTVYNLQGNFVGSMTSLTTAAGSNRYFGSSVAVGSGRIVVGSTYDTLGIGFLSIGSAHIYDINRNFIKKISHPDLKIETGFGFSVAVGCGRIVVGAPEDDIGGVTNSGAAYIYDLNGNYVGILTHPNPGGSVIFGYSVAVGSGRIVVGSRFDSTQTAYLYDLNGNIVGILTCPNITSSDLFGSSVAVGSGRVIIGAPNNDFSGIANAGAAYVYDLNGNYVGILTHPNAAAGDEFGYSVAVGSGRIVVGCVGDEVGSVSNAGSVLIYDLNRNYVGILTLPNSGTNNSFGSKVAVGSGRIVANSLFQPVTNNVGIVTTYVYSTKDYDHILDIL